MTDKPKRVLVVDDSLTVRKLVVEALSADPSLEIIGEAENGRRGIEMCYALRPDVVTMDMMMPVATGLTATEEIMASCPTPILIVSASINRTEALSTFDALAAGAVDVLDKPTCGEPPATWARRLRAAVNMVARIRVIRRPPRAAAHAHATRVRPPAPSRRTPKIIVIGASTGGPAATARVLRSLPAGFPVPIALVIHISPLFGASLAEWLAARCGLPVRLAQGGEALSAGVILAPPEQHLIVRGDRAVLDSGPERHSCRPSVDVLFESAAHVAGDRTVACLLTGMGADGAAGMLAVRHAGGETIAQDEATSEIWGMPGEAVRRGAATRVLPLDAIANALTLTAAPGRGLGALR